MGNRGLTIEDDCNVGIGTRILTETDNYDGTALVGSMFPLKYRKSSGAPLKICQFVNIGMNTTILPVDEIPIGVAIGANSLITKPLLPWSIYAGVPAKFIKPRSKDMINIKDRLE